MSVAGAAAVFFAVLMVLQRSLYSAAICLLLCLFQVAAVFFLAGAPLLGLLQVMIYAGAVMVLVVVTIMAAPAPAGSRWSRLSAPKPLALAAVVLPPAEVALIVWRGSAAAPLVGGGLAVQPAIGSYLFGPYAAATEAVTLLMFVAALALIEEPR